jgi:hypothetical protein
MKLVGSFGVLLAAATMLGGCGAGAGGTKPGAKAPADVFEAMNAELSHAVGTTTVTSASLPPPSPRSSLPPAVWEEEGEPAVLQTWGVPEDPYGF